MASMDISDDTNTETSSQATNPNLAPQACVSCKKQKRKCDKQLPACGLCQRIGRTCDYSADAQTGMPSFEEFITLKQKVSELENLIALSGSSNGSNGAVSHHDSNGAASEGSSPTNRFSPILDPSLLPGPTNFPSMFFLDSNAFEYERFQISAPYVKVPPGALTPLGNATELRKMVEQYFETVHTYFPVVSKIRLYQHLASPFHEPGADIALLFLSMKMVSSEIPDGSPPLTQLYQDVKSFYNYIESQNQFSVHLIQALVLTALYEVGHSIYPAAYLTIGHAARLGHAMGLHERQTPQLLARPTTWTEQEERRRIWWGVIVLDRFVNIGNRGKPFGSADPNLDTHLPTDDSHWDRGQMLVAAPLALSANQTIKAAPFARTCQASHLLGKVVRHLNDANLPVDFRYTEALQLHRTTRALAGLLPQEAEADDPVHRPTLCTSMAICYSALLTLYDGYSCSERAFTNAPETQLIMQKEAIDGLAVVSAQVMHLAHRVRSFVDRAGLHRVSPLIIDSLFQGAANYAWYVRESSDKGCADNLRELKDLLTVLNQRWKVAGEYLRIIESTEFQLASAIRQRSENNFLDRRDRGFTVDIVPETSTPTFCLSVKCDEATLERDIGDEILWRHVLCFQTGFAES